MISTTGFAVMVFGKLLPTSVGAVTDLGKAACMRQLDLIIQAVIHCMVHSTTTCRGMSTTESPVPLSQARALWSPVRRVSGRSKIRPT